MAGRPRGTQHLGSVTMPSPRRHQPPARSTPAGLARAALTAVLAGAQPTSGQRLLVIIAPQGDRILADLGAEVHDAACLARRLAAASARATQERLHDGLLAAGRLAIAGLDRIGRPERQRVIAAFLDTIADRGEMACVTLASHPAAAGLDAMLESRLSAGLIVTVPATEPYAPAAGRTSLLTVIRTTARVHGVSVASLIGQSRQRSIVRSRSIGMYVARVCTGASLNAIGSAFGGRDHTTAMRSVDGIQRRLEADPSLAGDVRDVLMALQGGDARSRPA
ncbi:MAG: helix-turn-helix domain-containing protein [Planctomycetaceae bacterium]